MNPIVDRPRLDIFVMPCPEGCEKSARVYGCERITITRPVEPDGSCYLCGGVGYVPHCGAPDIPVTFLDFKEGAQPV